LTERRHGVTMVFKREMVWARVDARIADAVREVARLRGVSISEYVRELLLTDLDARSSIFNKRLREDAK
jgi:hypothetical protein